MTDGTTYRLQFDVWPSQEAYDLIANLNNGTVTMTDAELEDASITQNKATGEYTLNTNTHLNTTYKYNGATYTDPSTWVEKNMDLPTETLTVKKIWNNPTDWHIGDDSGNGVKLYLTKDGENYLEGDKAITVAPESPNDLVWEAEKEIYISCGFIKQNTSTYKYEVMEEGHDYSIAEPESFAYYWDLKADTYHPMVINGEAHLLKLKEDATGTDGVDYYIINEKKYVLSDGEGENVLEAINDRRSSLNFSKAINDQSDDQSADTNELFEYTITVKDSKADTGTASDLNSDYYVWFSVYDSTADETVIDLTTSATAETGSSGYYYVPSGSSFTVSIKAGWNLRFINLPIGTTYTIVESSKTDWEFESAEGSATHYISKTEKETEAYSPTVTISSAKIEGIITQSNRAYYVTATNKWQPKGTKLTVNKVWNSGNFVTSHGTITVALFKDANSDGTITADEYIDGSERTLANGATSATYDKLSSLNGIVVREVTITTETTGESEDAVTTKTVTPIDPSGQIAVSGETTTAESETTNTYIVTYTPGTETDNSRTDSVTNTLLKTPIEVTKIGDWTVGTKLSGVQFKLYSDPNCTHQLTVDSTGNPVGTGGLITTGPDGKATVGTFMQGTYYLQEVKGAAGYNMLTDAVAFTINADGTVTYSSGNKNFDATQHATYEVTDRIGIYISNPSGVELPQTGGEGTALFYALGTILTLSSVLLILAKKRKESYASMH